MSDQLAEKDDEYYGLFYVQNVQLLWGKNHWVAGMILYVPLTLLLVRLSLLTILFILLPMFVGIILGPYTAESLYNKVKKYPEQYAEAGRRYAAMFTRLKWLRLRFSEPQLFWKTGLWSDFIFRWFVLGLVSLTCWYSLAFLLDGFKFFFSGAALLILPYLAFAFHWYAAWYWWKHKVVGPQRYKELCRF